jgi:hypothetical protein
MYGKFFITIAVIAFAATTIDVTSAFAQNQTSNLTATLSTPVNNTMTTTNITTTTPPPDMTLDDARKQYLSIWNQTEFNATFSTFIEPFSAAGYGVYEERNNVFAPGETIVLYVEPVGFDHRQVLDEEGNNTTLYLINMTADYEIVSINGTELQLLENVPVGSIISHRPNTELFLTLTLDLEIITRNATQEVQSFPTGNYIITYSVTDEVSGESFQLEKEITVAERVAVSSNLV